MLMIKKLAGYVLAGIGLLGFTYFKSYKGDIIPLPILWLILNLVVAATGAYLILRARWNKQIQKNNKTSAKLSRVKEKSVRVLIDLDNCDFKTSTISQLNTENISRVQMIDALYDPNRNYIENYNTVTYIIYEHKFGNTFEKFVSQPFPIDNTTLKYYISQNKIVLYVDRFDRTQYFFAAE
jgi:hypothetical protein